MLDILTIGDIKLDTFIQIEDANVFCKLNVPACQLCVEYGKKIPVQDVRTQIAGSAPNVAVALTKMRKQAAVYSLMGEDILHKIALTFLQDHGVDTSLVQSVSGQKTTFSAVLNFKGESTQLVSNEPNEYCLPQQIPDTRWMHISELGGDYSCLFREVLEYKAIHPELKISFNPGVVQIEERTEAFLHLIADSEVLFVNRAEALDLVERKDIEIENLLPLLHGMGPRYVVITDGRNGAYAYDGEQIDYAPMFPGERVEATGAGDAFASGFLGALMQGKTHAEALMWGAVNAAHVVQYIGPTEGLQTTEQITSQLANTPEYKTEELKG